jgi:hypothetical protein
VDVEFHLDRPWTLVDGPAALPVNDPSMEDAVRRCVRIAFPTRMPRPEVTVTSPPCPVAWDILISTPAATTRPTTRARFGTLPRRITCDVGETAKTPIAFFTRDVPDGAETFTLTLVPSPAAAETTTRLNSYWNGTLVFKDIPIPKMPPTPSTRPSTRPRVSSVSRPSQPPR